MPRRATGSSSKWGDRMSLLLGPDYGLLELTAQAPRIWLGGPSSNCWRMYYHSGNARWELDGGNGLVRYTMASPFDCNGPNVFDQKLFDHTLQAPASITVYPLSPLPCSCPNELEPDYGVINLTPYPPRIRETSAFGPDAGDLPLLAYSPTIHIPGGSTTVGCSITGVPNSLNVTCSSTDYPCINGFTFIIVYRSDLGYWTNPDDVYPINPCGHPVRFVMNCVGTLWNTSAFLNAPTGGLSGPMGSDFSSNPPFHLHSHGIFGDGSIGLSGRVDFDVEE